VVMRISRLLLGMTYSSIIHLLCPMLFCMVKQGLKNSLILMSESSGSPLFQDLDYEWLLLKVPNF
jgi:hypothetical protein